MNLGLADRTTIHPERAGSLRPRLLPRPTRHIWVGCPTPLVWTVGAHLLAWIVDGSRCRARGSSDLSSMTSGVSALVT